MTIHRGVLASLALASAAIAVQASAQTFSEGTFASGTYSLTPTYNSGGAFIGVGECLTCGNPDSALRFVLFYPGASAAALGVVLNNTAYDPGVQGAINSLSISLQKNLTSTIVGPFGNTIRPLIQQNGNYYLASMSLADVTGPTTTGYRTGTGTFNASDFTLYDFTTGAFGVGNPNFASGVVKFGIGQIGTVSSAGNTFADYDNFNIRLATGAVPEPATWGMMILGLGAAGYAMRRRRQPHATPRAA